MPIYEYRCAQCSEGFERTLPISRYDEPQSCDVCGGEGKRLISKPHIIFAGDGWVSKNLRVEGQMRSKNERLDARQNEMKREAPGVRLAPNVGGERTESWTDAARLAADRGKDASTYEPMIRKEKENAK